MYAHITHDSIEADQVVDIVFTHDLPFVREGRSRSRSRGRLRTRYHPGMWHQHCGHTITPLHDLVAGTGLILDPRGQSPSATLVGLVVLGTQVSMLGVDSACLASCSSHGRQERHRCRSA